MFDVIISGAGPSGSKCAEILAKNGFKVALIEKDTNWRKPCGGGVSARIFKYYPQLRKFNIPKKKNIVMFSSQYYKLENRWEKLKDYSIVMDRLELDNIMRDVAVDAGVELFDKNISFDYVIKNQKKIGIRTKTPSGVNEYLGKIIIIADGMSSKLAIKSGLRERWKTEQLGIAKCAILEGENSLDSSSIYIFFRPYKGYGWIFPIDEHRFNIGCGTFEEDNFSYNLNEIYKEFLNNPNIKDLLPRSNYKQIWMGSYPLPSVGVLEKSLYGENLMLIGDAAGFVSPISGEGIHASIVSGDVAAEIAINALEKEDISENTLKKYKFHPKIKKIIRNFKIKHSMADFFFENRGQNLNTVFKIAEKDIAFKQEVINIFLYNATPPKEFFQKIKNTIF